MSRLVLWARSAVVADARAAATAASLRDAAAGGTVAAVRLAMAARLLRTARNAHGTYERGGDIVAAIRRNRDRLAVLQEGHERIEEALAAIVDVDLGERLTDADARVRALLDLDAWRALRDHGVTGADAVETTASMLDAWLARRQRTAAPAAA